MKKTNFVSIFMLIILLALSTGLMAVDYYVDPTGTDDGDHGTGTGTDAWATIKYALANVSDPTTATIVINVAAGTYTQGDDYSHINRAFTDLTIDGAGATSTIVQCQEAHYGDYYVFRISSNETVTIRDMKIQNGGKGIRIADHCTVTVLNSTLCYNGDATYGGGIENRDTSDLIVENCTFHNNQAASGAAIYSGDNDLLSTATITNCTIYDNDSGGSVAGAVHMYRCTATITNCTIVNNESSGSYCGGLMCWGPSETGTLYIKNNLIANNISTGSNSDFYQYSGQPIQDNGYNIVEFSNYSFEGDGSITGDQTDLFGTGIADTPSLAYNSTINGTQTLALEEGSVAIDAGNDSANGSVDVPSTDQRGASRIDATDIGAFEFGGDPPVPVNLSAFYALYIGEIPTLYWTTQTEENNAYWNVYRGTSDNFTTAALLNANNPVPGNGTINSASDYIYVDILPVVQNANYWYWIEDVSIDGETEVHEPITLYIPFEDTPVTPENYGLQQNYPNPFNPSTSISFTLSEESDVELIIYNVKGAKINTIFNDHIYADQVTTAVWDGNDINGKQVSSGVYLYKLITNTKIYSKKMLMMK